MKYKNYFPKIIKWLGSEKLKYKDTVKDMTPKFLTQQEKFCLGHCPNINWSPPKAELLFILYIFYIITSLRRQKSASRTYEVCNPAEVHVCFGLGSKEPYPKIKKKEGITLAQTVARSSGKTRKLQTQISVLSYAD